MPRPTSKKQRLKRYEEQISQLRLAQICMNDELARDAVEKLISLNCRFEKEDYPEV